MSRSISAQWAKAAGVALILGTVASPALATEDSQINVVISTTGEPSNAGQSEGGGTFQVRARVPVACWVRPETAVIVENGRSGGVLEACNNPGGFTVTATYRPLKATESAELVYDDRPFDLSKSGAQVLRHSSMATIKRVDYRFGAVVVDAPLVLSLTIQPI